MIYYIHWIKTITEYKMSLFGKKEEQKEEEIPTLPDLPQLPELPRLKENNSEKNFLLPQLPSIPSSSFGEKFSRSAIKEAVTGRERGEEEDADDFRKGMMQKPHVREIPADFKIQKTIDRFHEARRIPEEPIFIRIDKFEEALKTFEKIKIKLEEIEKMLQDTKRIKEEEEKELVYWEKEMQEIKDQISKVDSNVFSKLD